MGSSAPQKTKFCLKSAARAFIGEEVVVGQDDRLGIAEGADIGQEGSASTLKGTSVLALKNKCDAQCLARQEAQPQKPPQAPTH